MTTKISYSMAFLLGLGMIFLGTRFYTSPEVATSGYGIHFNAQGDYSFHYIKGIRDIFSGLIICVFVLLKERRALGITLLAGTIIPIADMLIVLSKVNNGIFQAVPHSTAIAICAVFGILLLVIRPQSKKAMKTPGYIKLISSVDNNDSSIVELNILPGEKTPWHYHTLFSETFAVLKGTLEVGKGKDTIHLKHGDVTTIMPDEKHYYHNISNEECVITTTINPEIKTLKMPFLS